MSDIYSEIQSGDALLIDVRTQQEWSAGHVNEAQHLPLSNIQQGETPSVSKDTRIYTYCRSGSRSQMASMLLAKQGYYNVENLGGVRDVLSIDERFELIS